MENMIEKEDNINMEHIANSLTDIVQPNKVINGEIVTIDNEFAYINVGIKSEGKVSLEEFDAKPSVGDNIHVMLLNKRQMDGMFVFSKLAADRVMRWKKFIEWYNEGNRHIEGVVKGISKKSIIVDCAGLTANLPFPQAGDIKIKNSVRDRSKYLFTIFSVDEKNNSITLSRKDFLDAENSRKWNEFVSTNQVGSRVTGKAVKILESGVIINVGGIDAFLNRDDITWKKVFKKKKYIALDTEQEYVILSIDQEKRRMTIGLKQLTTDPWIGAGQRYRQGDVVNGKVVTVANFGVFLEIEDCIEGLIGSGDISWTKRNLNLDNLFKKGQALQALILSVSEEDRRIALGLKQLAPNPWDSLHERYPVRSVRKGKIKKIAPFGIFVELEEDIDGLIHSSDISWDDNSKNTAGKYNEGDEVEFIVLDIKKDDMRISCGIKQLTKSPWEVLKEKYPPRSRVSGVITTIANFGLFVKLSTGEEGLVHISEASAKKTENLNELFKVGDQVNAIVLGVDSDKKRISLSIKHYDSIVEKEELKKVLNSARPTKVTFGDILKEKLGE
jgi:small subunit ribosomal protein S1